MSYAFSLCDWISRHHCLIDWLVLPWRLSWRKSCSRRSWMKSGFWRILSHPYHWPIQTWKSLLSLHVLPNLLFGGPKSLSVSNLSQRGTSPDVLINNARSTDRITVSAAHVSRHLWSARPAAAAAMRTADTRQQLERWIATNGPPSWQAAASCGQQDPKAVRPLFPFSLLLSQPPSHGLKKASKIIRNAFSTLVVTFAFRDKLLVAWPGKPLSWLLLLLLLFFYFFPFFSSSSSFWPLDPRVHSFFSLDL